MRLLRSSFQTVRFEEFDSVGDPLSLLRLGFSPVDTGGGFRGITWEKIGFKIWVLALLIVEVALGEELPLRCFGEMDCF
jgi:hypothetical protein